MLQQRINRQHTEDGRRFGDGGQSQNSQVAGGVEGRPRFDQPFKWKEQKHNVAPLHNCKLYKSLCLFGYCV